MCATQRREVLTKRAKYPIRALELAARQRDVAAQDRRLVHERRVGVVRLELLEQVERGLVLLGLVARVRRLEQRLGQARRVARHLEVVVERVVAAVRLVRGAAEREPREVLHLEEAVVDVEGVAVE